MYVSLILLIFLKFIIYLIYLTNDECMCSACSGFGHVILSMSCSLFSFRYCLCLFIHGGGGCWSVGGSRSHCMIFKVQASLAFFDGKPFPLNQVHCLLLFIYMYKIGIGTLRQMLIKSMQTWKIIFHQLSYMLNIIQCLQYFDEADLLWSISYYLLLICLMLRS